MTFPGCCAAIDLSTAFIIFELGAPATGIVLLLSRKVVHCYTQTVLAPDAAKDVMLTGVCLCRYIGTGEGTGAGWGV